MSYDRLVGFGEAMLRLSVPPGGSLETTDHLCATVGGAELNGLIAAARSGMPATWLSAVPADARGRLVLRHARANGVTPICLTSTGRAERLGVYFLEMAAAPRPQRIIYDRRGSSFATLDADAIDWHDHLTPTTCLYLTGITAALGDGPHRALEDAVRVAREVGATVALDVNYRAALWSRDDASAWLRTMLPHVDILSASIGDLESAGITGPDIPTAAVEAFGLEALVTTTKQTDGGEVELALHTITANEQSRQRARVVVVDPVGAGDALFGTFLAWLPRRSLDQASQAALGAAVSCYGLMGDALTTDAWHADDPQGVVR
jgi:2-dehydro-3-deoxygluconokinase